MDAASKSTLENEFGTSNEEGCIKQILEKGSAQEVEVRIYPSR
jgi:ribosome maturation protein Sdo1